MAVSNYATLRATVARRLGGRTDLITSGDVDNFIDLFEARANRYLRHHSKETVATVTINSSGKGSLPTDFLWARSARWSGSPNIEMTPTSVGGANNASPFDTSLSPSSAGAGHFDISGPTFSVTPISSGSVTLTYSQKLPPLSASTGSTTNWLMDLAPDAYLHGTMAEGHRYSRNYNDAGAAEAMAQAILDEVNGVSNLAQYMNAEIVLSGLVTDND